MKTIYGILKRKFFDVSVLTTSGVACVFPFTYNGRAYNGCTSEGALSQNGTLWCATAASITDASTAWGPCDLQGEVY